MAHAARHGLLTALAPEPLDDLEHDLATLRILFDTNDHKSVKGRAHYLLQLNDAPGLGLTNRFIIDQHFRQRDRLGRLATALAFNPFAIGIGLDEDTAAFIGPDNTLEVEGSGSVTVIDAADLQFSSMDRADEGDAVCLLGLGVHMLVHGATFNLHTRRAGAGTLISAKE